MRQAALASYDELLLVRTSLEASLIDRKSSVPAAEGFHRHQVSEYSDDGSAANHRSEDATSVKNRVNDRGNGGASSDGGDDEDGDPLHRTIQEADSILSEFHRSIADLANSITSQIVALPRYNPAPLEQQQKQQQSGREEGHSTERRCNAPGYSLLGAEQSAIHSADRSLMFLQDSSMEDPRSSVGSVSTRLNESRSSAGAQAAVPFVTTSTADRASADSSSSDLGVRRAGTADGIGSLTPLSPRLDSTGSNRGFGDSLSSTLASVDVALILERYSDQLVDLVSAKVAKRLEGSGGTGR